jgi:hypothetical protein
MADSNIVVTLKQPGGVWPLVRGAFAVIGLGAMLVWATVLGSPDPQGRAKQLIEDLDKQWRGYQAKHTRIRRRRRQSR